MSFALIEEKTDLLYLKKKKKKIIKYFLKGEKYF